MRRHLPILLAALAGVSALAPLLSPATAGEAAEAAANWRTDPAWYDGRAECCVYTAERKIYGEPRHFTARIYTNKQRMSAQSTVKDDAGDVEVFKHHHSERVTTRRYDYDFSTASFLETDGLELFKLTCATQEDCGASFKQLWRDGRENRWMESVYFPGAGMDEGRFAGKVVAEDSLFLWLRQFPFQRGEGTSLRVKLLPSQKSTRRVTWEPLDVTVTHVSTERKLFELGTRTAHHLRLDGPGHPGADFWFDADGSAPALHVLLAYEDGRGTKYSLKLHERRAYWER